MAALDHWNIFNGWCQSRALKPTKLPESDFLDLVLFWLTDGASEKSLADFERQLTLPPPMHKVSKDDPNWSAQSEMALFKRAAKTAKTK